VLNLKSPRFGHDWVATTDLASRDAEGFLYIHGRSDQAIIRGGFKVLPEKVAEVFRTRSDVGEACVIGIDDERLGQVPVAVVQPAPGQPRPDPAALMAFARENLAPYQVPVAIEIVDELPRTATMKVSLEKVRDMIAGRLSARR
jgi:acyl-CoA synthetase (AMP-forming)/AMP-acid ligase II